MSKDCDVHAQWRTGIRDAAARQRERSLPERRRDQGVRQEDEDEGWEHETTARIGERRE